MIDPPVRASQSDLRATALSRWDDEGGALSSVPVEDHASIPDMTNAELAQLRIRIIAMENTLIAVLAEGSDHQLAAVRELADLISPRQGSTPHPLTTQAAKHMNDLVQRAIHVREVARS